MVFGWGSPRKTDAGVSQEDATALFARIASGKSCTPSEGSETSSKDSKEPSSDASSSLKSPASVNQSNMMPNPNQERAAQQRCERREQQPRAICPSRMKHKTHLVIFFFRHPHFIFLFIEDRKRKSVAALGQSQRSVRSNNRRDTADMMPSTVTAVPFKPWPALRSRHAVLLTINPLSPCGALSIYFTGVICRHSECLQPSLSVSATKICRSISVTQRRRGNIQVNRCSTTPS